MDRRRGWRDVVFSDLGVLVLLALAKLLLHVVTNSGSGWHRDELQMLDDARHLAWGYVAYPPLTPFVGSVALAILGPSTAGVRFFGGLAQAVAMVLTGLMVRELGGSRRAQVTASVASAIAGIGMSTGALFQYVSFDYLWWVLTAYLVLRLLKSGNPRWWLGIGAAIGLGAMTKYAIAFFVIAILAGLLLTPARRYLFSPWLLAGAGIALLIFLPNLVWQVQHDFITLKWMAGIHARDVGMGRTSGYLTDQLYVAANPVTLPLWLAGLYYFLRAPAGRSFRALGWTYVAAFLLLLVAQGRGYYLAPAYPMLLAGGAAWVEATLIAPAAGRRRLTYGTVWTALAVGGLIVAATVLPVWPVGSAPWNVAAAVDNDLREEVGWPELVQAVGQVYAGLPAVDRPRAAVLATNYGEAGAIDLYGPAYGLPRAIAVVNSYWERGYGDPPPETLVVVGAPPAMLSGIFQACEVAGRVPNPYGIENEEQGNPNIYVCRGVREPWPQLWARLRYFG